MGKYDYTEEALSILQLEGVELTEQEIQILNELDQLPYSDDQIISFLKSGRREKVI